MMYDIELEYEIPDNESTDGIGTDYIPLLFIAGLLVPMDKSEPTIIRDLAKSNHNVIIFDNRSTENSSIGTKDSQLTSLRMTLLVC